MTTLATTAIDQWLYTQLTASGAPVGVAVYSDVVPEGASLPAIVFQSLSAFDVSNVGANRIATRCRYKVAAIAEAERYTGQLATIAAWIDTQLHKQSNSGAGIVSCVRDEIFRLTEQRDERQYRQLGGLYTIFAQEF